MINFRQFFSTQRWWGKILGGFFGYLIGRAPGAIMGILVGNFFDRGLAEHFSRPYWHYYQEKRDSVQKVFFQATFTIMGFIAKADGRISEQEIALAKQMMDQMKLSTLQKKQAKDYFTQGKKKDFDPAPLLALLERTCHNNPELLKLFIDIQYRTALADSFSIYKEQALDIVFKQLGFAPLHKQYRFYEDFGTNPGHTHSKQEQSSRNNQHYQQQSTTSLGQAYAILEVNPQASKQEIKRAYRRLISRNHPDKLIAQGLPEEMIKLANDKTQKITKAYNLICTSKGW